MHYQSKGNVTITKVFQDGKIEIIEEAECNIVTEGMAIGVTKLFAGEGSDNPADYRISKFQVGSGGIIVYSRDFYDMSGVITDYGSETGSLITTGDQLYKIPGNFTGLTNIASLGYKKGTFANIPESQVSQVLGDAIKITIILDEDTANGEVLNEVAIFLDNPDGQVGITKSMMAAHKTFTSIPKTSDFKLVFDWVIHPIDCSYCNLNPTFNSVYYGPSATPVSARRGTQVMDVYLPPAHSAEGAGAIIWLHAGSYTHSDKKNIPNPSFFQSALGNGIAMISADYALGNTTGELAGLDDGQNYPFAFFTSAIDSSGANLPSSISPFRLPNEKETPHTDCIRAIQFVRSMATEWNINPDLIAIAGNVTGGDIAAWAGYFCECSATLGGTEVGSLTPGGGTTIDPVEAYSSRVRCVSVEQAVTNMDYFYPYKLGSLADFQYVPLRKNLDLSGSMYAPSGQGTNDFSTALSRLYPSGVFFTSAVSALSSGTREKISDVWMVETDPTFSSVPALLTPTALIYNSQGTYPDFMRAGGSSLTDWYSFRNLPFIYEWREVDWRAKQYWSAQAHASSLGVVRSEFSTDSDFSAVPWGDANNAHSTGNAPYFQGTYMWTSTSSAGTSAVPSWQLLTNRFLGMTTFNMREIIAKVGISQFLITGNAFDYLEPTGPPEAIADGNEDSWYVSALEVYHGGASEANAAASALPEPGINISMRTSIHGPVYVDSSSLGQGPRYYSSPYITPDKHDPMFSHVLVDTLTSVQGHPATSSITLLDSPSHYANVFNSFNEPNNNNRVKIDTTRATEITRLFAFYDAYYNQYL